MMMVKIVVTDRIAVFPMVLTSKVMSTLIPASKRMMINASVLIRGDKEAKRLVSKYPRTGPRTMPKPSAQRISGMRVFE
jgi:hypothetical protein